MLVVHGHLLCNSMSRGGMSHEITLEPLHAEDRQVLCLFLAFFSPLRL